MHAFKPSEHLRIVLTSVLFMLVGAAGNIATVHPELASSDISSTVTQDVYASSNELPVWLYSNTWGKVPDDSLSSITSVETNGQIEFENDVSLYGSLGLSFRIFDDQADLQLSQTFLAADWKGIRLRGGIARERRGDIPMPDLSSGSLSISGNAQPVPNIQFWSPEYLSLPYSNESIAVKAGLSHGWFTGDRWIDNTLLHEKWTYIRFGGPDDSVSLYGGLIHQVLWGGSLDPDSAGSEPARASWSNFIRVLTARSGGDDAPETDQLNVIGDQLGTYDIGFSWNHEHVKIEGYYQHFFEDGSGMRWRNGLDGLFGIAGTAEHGIPIVPSMLTYERILTNYQSGQFLDATVDGEKVVLGGQDSYYHNGVYRTGWSHQDRILGTPLFVLQGTGAQARIASNRIRGHHVGVGGSVTEDIEYRLLSSHAWHYPAYAEETIVADDRQKLQQWNALVEVAYQFPYQQSQAKVLARIGWDIGSVYDDTWGAGLGLSVEY